MLICLTFCVSLAECLFAGSLMEDLNSEEFLARLLTASASANESAFADIIGVSAQAVYQAQKKGKIPLTWALIVSQKFNVTLDWLIRGCDPITTSKIEPLPSIAEKRVAALERRVAELEEENRTLQHEALDAYKRAFSLLEKGMRSPTTDAQSYAPAAPSIDHVLNEGTPLPWEQRKP